jgi:2-octaprenyl-6-methoxyphenol hydroxylase
MKSKNDFPTIFIGGGGLAGLIMALRIAHLPLNILIADPLLVNKTIKSSSRTSALMEESLTILKSIDVYDACLKEGADLIGLSIQDHSINNVKSLGHIFYANELNQSRFGRNIFNHILHEATLQKIQHKKNISLIPHSIHSINHHISSIDITTSDLKTHKCSLLIGADGRTSKVRELSNISVWQHNYSQTAITGVISHSKPHHNISTEFHRDGGPFTLVPLNGNRSSFVWMDHTSETIKILSLNRDQFVSILQQRSQNILGEITLETNPESWPIIGLKAKQLIAKRTALIAESAHVLSPIGAQGLNLSLRDIDALARNIETYLSLGYDVGSSQLLETYSSERTLDIDLRVSGVDILNRAVQSLPQPLKFMRRLILKTAGDIKPLRHSLMREGLRGQKL